MISFNTNKLFICYIEERKNIALTFVARELHESSMKIGKYELENPSECIPHTSTEGRLNFSN